MSLQRTLGFALLAIRSHRISVAGLALMGLMTVFASNILEVIGFLYDELQNMRAIKNARTTSRVYNKPILNYGCGITDLGDVNADICERDVPRFKLISPSPAPTPFRKKRRVMRFVMFANPCPLSAQVGPDSARGPLCL